MIRAYFGYNFMTIPSQLKSNPLIINPGAGRGMRGVATVLPA
jgi:hypothetical protein